MRRSLKEKIEEFRAHWKHYLLQSILAGITIFVLLLLLNIEKRPIIIASIGATAFIIFAMPKHFTAEPRNVIGGHVVGIITGCLCALIPHSTFLGSISIYALAVGLSIFIMVVIDTEHPPASGTALGFAIAGFSFLSVITVLGCVLALTLIRWVLKRHLRDLV